MLLRFKLPPHFLARAGRETCEIFVERGKVDVEPCGGQSGRRGEAGLVERSPQRLALCRGDVLHTAQRTSLAVGIALESPEQRRQEVGPAHCRYVRMKSGHAGFRAWRTQASQPQCEEAGPVPPDALSEAKQE